MKYFLKIAFLCLCIAGSVFACKQKQSSNEEVIPETPTSGTLIMLTDNTVQPIVEDVLAVFHSVYTRADIKQVNLSENQILQQLQDNKAKVAVLSRKLTAEEEKQFTSSGIVPRATPFATDGVALIVNKSYADTIVSLEEVYKVLKGEHSDKIKSLVFDNANSSIIKFMLNKAGVSQIPEKGVYSQGSSENVIKYIHDNPGSIGLIGVDWIVQAPSELLQYVENIEVLAVNNTSRKGGQNKFYKPNQTNIATGNYPLTRKLYVLNYQGKEGLGTGFANYITAQQGQRIVLKSGLLPETIPPRDIQVRNKL